MSIKQLKVSYFTTMYDIAFYIICDSVFIYYTTMIYIMILRRILLNIKIEFSNIVVIYLTSIILRRFYGGDTKVKNKY